MNVSLSTIVQACEKSCESVWSSCKQKYGCSPLLAKPRGRVFALMQYHNIMHDSASVLQLWHMTLCNEDLTYNLMATGKATSNASATVHIKTHHCTYTTACAFWVQVGSWHRNVPYKEMSHCKRLQSKSSSLNSGRIAFQHRKGGAWKPEWRTQSRGLLLHQDWSDFVSFAYQAMLVAKTYVASALWARALRVACLSMAHL